MKKWLLMGLFVLIVGCASDDPWVGWSAEVSFCAEDTCDEQVQLRLNDEQLKELLTHLENLPQTAEPADFSGQEYARLVLSKGDFQKFYIEYGEAIPYGVSARLMQPDGSFISVEEENRLSHLLRALMPSAEEITESITEDHLLTDGLLVSDYLRTDEGHGSLLNTNADNENSLKEIDQALSLLFYIDENFDESTPITDQKRLLTGILQSMVISRRYSSDPSALVWKKHVLENTLVIPVQEVETYAQTLMAEYTFPKLDDEMIGMDNRYNINFYYDTSRQAVIADYAQFGDDQYVWDRVLMPIEWQDHQLRVARFPVRIKADKYSLNAEAVRPDFGDHVLTYYGSDYHAVATQVLNFLEMTDLFDVTFNDEHQIVAIEKVYEHEAYEVQPLSVDDFVYSNMGECSVYTMQTTHASALQMNDYGSLRVTGTSARCMTSVLRENENLIMIEMKICDADDFDAGEHYFFDKTNGELLNEGMINVRFYEGNIEQKVLEQLKAQEMNACPPAYEGRLVEECYVAPLIDNGVSEAVLYLPETSWRLNEEGQLEIPVLVRRFGSIERLMWVVVG